MAIPHVAIKKHFRKLKDPRIQRHKRHPLINVITIAICAVICGCQDWQEIELFANKRRDWLAKFLDLANGIPSHDTLERVFDRIDPRAFQTCFREWINALSEALAIKHIAIDGKTLCGSGTAKLKALHLVSAWASEHHLSLGQIACAEKSNEITAIPELLQTLELQGALVTIDAMGCQKEIAAKILERGGDYVLTVKENQANLLEDIQSCFRHAFDTNFRGLEYDEHETHDRGHGRIEKRSYTILVNPQGIRNQDAWQELTVIGMCHHRRIVKGKPSDEVRYFIGSRAASAKTYAKVLRNHWGIENNLHWQMDVSFGEDASRITKRNGAENFALLRRLALTLLKQHPSKYSIAKKQLAAALDTEFLEEALRHAGNSNKV